MNYNQIDSVPVYSVKSFTFERSGKDRKGPHSPADMGMDCAFDDTSMSFGTLLEHALRKTFSYRPSQNCPVAKMAAILQNGGHFPKWPPPVVILPVAQVLDYLGY